MTASYPPNPRRLVESLRTCRVVRPALCMLLASLSAFAGPRHRVLDVPPKQITVDGKAGAKEWPIDSVRPMPCAIPVSTDASAYDTETWIACDGTSLFLLINVNVAPDKPLVMKGNWGGRDGLEIAFCDARVEKSPIISALCYPDGTFTGQSVGGPRATPVELMGKAMTYAATVGKQGWTAEMAIPFAQVGIPLEGLQMLNFNLNIRRMSDPTWMVWARTRGPVWLADTAGKLLFGDVEVEEDANDFAAQQLNSTWLSRADPDEHGLKEGWATQEASDEWTTDRIDLRRNWGMKAFRNAMGWAWLRQEVMLPADIRQEQRVWLFLPAVDEQCEVYIAGSKVAEHTATSTGLPPGRLWNDPILIDVTSNWEKRDAALDVAIRVLAYSSSGGLRKPAFLIGSGDTDLKAPDVYNELVDMGFLRALERDFRVADIPDLPPHPAPRTLGSRIQRTMALLATSTATMRRRVKILFYGQSITAGMHWVQITNALRQRFPYAIIEAENRAIGGFTAPSLCRTAVADLYPTDADLVVFHDYGGENTGELERMISTLRQVSTAEILVYTHTVAWVDNPEGLKGRTRGDDISAAFNRYLVQKYNCELVEAREEWQQFLELHGIGINEYMGDKVRSNVHPNAAGHTLLAELCLRHFQFNPYHPGGWVGRVRWVEARGALEEVHSGIALRGPWESDSHGIIAKEGECSLTLPFHGNRIDIVPHPDRVTGTFNMMIDGKSPAELPELFACTKADGIRPGDSWPVFKRVTLPSAPTPIPQTWTAKVTACDLTSKTFQYAVHGSVTGTDGSGSNQADFVSNSGQIRIQRRDCFLIRPLTYRKMDCPPNLEVAWEVYPRFIQPVSLKPALERNVDRRITLFSGLRNGPHTLTLTWAANGPAGIKAFVVHRPPAD